MSSLPDSDLTARAREVIAGLSDSLRTGIEYDCGRGHIRGHIVRRCKRLEALGLATVEDNGRMRSAPGGCDDGERWKVKRTDLGREVARLLALEVSRG